MVNLELLSQPSISQLARAGNFQAIAYWLNTYLVPQDIYARVAVDRPGWLLVLVEFCQPPDRDRLNRFVCHRLCRLNSDVIQGVRIMARPLGSSNIWWDQSIQLAAEPRRSARRVRSSPLSRHPAQIPSSTQPSTASRPLRNRRRSPAALALASRPTVSPAMAESLQALTESARNLTAALVESASQLSPTQVVTLSKAAAAVFLVGFGVEIAGRNLSLWGDVSGRPRMVQTASGQVPAIQVRADSDDPTVTLTFSSDPAVNVTSIDSRAQVPPPSVIGRESTAWPDSQRDGASSLESLTADSLETELVSGSGNETAYAIATSLEGAPSTAAPETASLSSDVLMTNLDHPVKDAQSLPGSNPGANSGTSLNQATNGLTRSPSNASITVVNLSGEPLMQNGSTGLVKTLDTLEKAGLHTVGAGRNRHEARRPEIIDVRGKRIAYLGYSDSEAHAANRWRAGTNPALKEQVAEDIRAIRDQVDWVVVNYHWSQDLASFPADWQMTVAHHAIDQGADLVVGYHPNVLQGAEIYKGRAIAYSLGDFVFQDGGQAANVSGETAPVGHDNLPEAPIKAQYDTAMLKVSIKDDQMRLEFLPVQVKDSQPAIAQGEKSAEILRYLGQASALFETPLRSPAILNRLTNTLTPPTSTQEPDASSDTLHPTPDDEFTPSPAKSLPPEDSSDSFVDYPNSDYPESLNTTPVSPTPSTATEATEATLSPVPFVTPQPAQFPTSHRNDATQPSATLPFPPSVPAPELTSKMISIAALDASVTPPVAENLGNPVVAETQPDNAFGNASE